MDKKTFVDQIAEFRRHNNFAFVFGDIHLPVDYHEKLGVLSVKMPASEVMMPVNYNIDLLDNLHNLMEKLLAKYPQLEE